MFKKLALTVFLMTLAGYAKASYVPIALSATGVNSSTVNVVAMTNGSTVTVTNPLPVVVENTGSSRLDASSNVYVNNQASATATVPSYSAGENSVNMTLGGALRSDITSWAGNALSTTLPLPVQSTGTVNVAIVSNTTGASSATGSAVPANAQYIGGIGSGNLTGVIVCDSTASINTASSGLAVVISSQSAKSTYICSWDVVAGGTTNFDLEYSTVAGCASASTKMTGPYPLIANTGIAKGNGIGMVLKAAPANVVCINNGSAVQVSGSISYTQF